MMVMKVDKVADEVTNTEVEKVTNMMAEFATNTSYLAAKFLTNESGATWWPNFQLMHVAPPGGQISNYCMWRHLVAKFPTKACGAT